MKYPVVEKFISINGEGARAGELAAFIRLKGCNLRCPYCDTKWAYSVDAPAEFISSEELCAFTDGITNVTITGGEPMLYPIGELCEVLIKNGHRVEIETNGSISIGELAKSSYRPVFTLDYKCPSSKMEQKMNIENYKYLMADDTVKFVVSNDSDLIRAAEIIEKNSLTEKCHVYFSPVFGEITAENIVEFMKDNKLNNVRIQLQLHKYIWQPEMRGV